ncbi:MAG: hypothetical protein GYA17_03095 [Chloroflexi bacterium]|jgi:hypothetical protein|nr:hypothetical protein [Anaerolineaceae bacterium]NMB87318.1 hypothetical protein [Chloroflexota bacterium]
MATPEDRLRILRMVQEGKVTPEEGSQMLEALEDANRPDAQPASGKPARWLRVRVTDTNSGKLRVNVRMPISLVTTGVKMGARFSPEVEGLDMAQLMEYVRAGRTGQIVDLFDDVDGEHIEVIIE